MSQQTNDHSILCEFKIQKDDLIKVFEVLAEFQGDQGISFEVSNEGLWTRFLDPHHVAMIDLGITAQGFEKLETSVKSYFTIENTKQTLKKLKSIDEDQILVYYTSEKVYLTSNSIKFTFNNTDTQPSDQALPKIPYDSILQIKDLKNLQKVHKKLTGLGYSYATYQAINRSLTITSIEDKDQIDLILDSNTIEPIKNNDDSRSTYSLDYLEPFLKSIDPAFKVEFAFSSVKPLMIKLDLNNYIRLSYWLAPRVET